MLLHYLTYTIMAESINSRIKLIIDTYFNGNVSDFCRKVGIKQPTLNTIIGARQSKPSYEIINAIANSINEVSLEWLITGKGDILKENKHGVSIGDNNHRINVGIGSNIKNSSNKSKTTSKNYPTDQESHMAVAEDTAFYYAKNNELEALKLQYTLLQKENQHLKEKIELLQKLVDALSK